MLKIACLVLGVVSCPLDQISFGSTDQCVSIDVCIPENGMKLSNGVCMCQSGLVVDLTYTYCYECVDSLANSQQTQCQSSCSPGEVISIDGRQCLKSCESGAVSLNGRCLCSYFALSDLSGCVSSCGVDFESNMTTSNGEIQVCVSSCTADQYIDPTEHKCWKTCDLIGLDGRVCLANDATCADYGAQQFGNVCGCVEDRPLIGTNKQCVQNCGVMEFLSIDGSQCVTVCSPGQALNLLRTQCIVGCDASASVGISNGLVFCYCPSTQFITSSGGACVSMCFPGVGLYQHQHSNILIASDSPVSQCVDVCPSGYAIELLEQKCVLQSDCGANAIVESGKCVCLAGMIIEQSGAACLTEATCIATHRYVYQAQRSFCVSSCAVFNGTALNHKIDLFSQKCISTCGPNTIVDAQGKCQCIGPHLMAALNAIECETVCSNGIASPNRTRCIPQSSCGPGFIVDGVNKVCSCPGNLVSTLALVCVEKTNCPEGQALNLRQTACTTMCGQNSIAENRMCKCMAGMVIDHRATPWMSGCIPESQCAPSQFRDVKPGMFFLAETLGLRFCVADCSLLINQTVQLTLAISPAGVKCVARCSNSQRSISGYSAKLCICGAGSFIALSGETCENSCSQGYANINQTRCVTADCCQAVNNEYTFVSSTTCECNPGTVLTADSLPQCVPWNACPVNQLLALDNSKCIPASSCAYEAGSVKCSCPPEQYLVIDSTNKTCTAQCINNMYYSNNNKNQALQNLSMCVIECSAGEILTLKQDRCVSGTALQICGETAQLDATSSRCLCGSGLLVSQDLDKCVSLEACSGFQATIRNVIYCVDSCAVFNGTQSGLKVGLDGYRCIQTCPENSEAVSDSCVCSTGYLLQTSKQQCAVECLGGYPNIARKKCVLQAFECHSGPVSAVAIRENQCVCSLGFARSLESCVPWEECPSGYVASLDRTECVLEASCGATAARKCVCLVGQVIDGRFGVYKCVSLEECSQGGLIAVVSNTRICVSECQFAAFSEEYSYMLSLRGDQCVPECETGAIQLDKKSCIDTCLQGVENLQRDSCVSSEDCGDYAVSNGNRCVCVEGWVIFQGKCVKNCEIPGQIFLNDGVCGCNFALSLNGSECVSECGAYEMVAKGQCACVLKAFLDAAQDKCVLQCNGSYEVEGPPRRCVAECPPNTFVYDGKCVPICPNGYTVLLDTCQLTCPANTALIDGVCVQKQTQLTYLVFVAIAVLAVVAVIFVLIYMRRKLKQQAARPKSGLRLQKELLSPIPRTFSRKTNGEEISVSSRLSSLQRPESTVSERSFSVKSDKAPLTPFKIKITAPGIPPVIRSSQSFDNIKATMVPREYGSFVASQSRMEFDKESDRELEGDAIAKTSKTPPVRTKAQQIKFGVPQGLAPPYLIQ